MSKKIAIIISPNWRDYASKYLADCLKSLAKLNLADFTVKVWLIDNESSELSYNFIVGVIHELPLQLPFEIIRLSDNAGFAKGNNAAMQAALDQGFDYLLLMNMDAEIASDCLIELIKVAEQDAKIAAVQARLMMFDDQEKINSLGNVTHFLGFGYCDNYGEKFSMTNDQLPNKSQIKNSKKFQIPDSRFQIPICYPSGAGVLFKAEVLKKVGLFDEEFWMYNEDQDLGWRLWLAGYICVLAYDAVIYHKYEFSRSISKYYYMDRNRLLAIFKSYRLGSLILIAPALMVWEIGLFFFAIKGGWLKEKLRVYQYFYQPKLGVI